MKTIIVSTLCFVLSSLSAATGNTAAHLIPVDPPLHFPFVPEPGHITPVELVKLEKSFDEYYKTLTKEGLTKSEAVWFLEHEITRLLKPVVPAKKPAAKPLPGHFKGPF